MAENQVQACACETIDSTNPDAAILDAWERRKAAWAQYEALPEGRAAEGQQFVDIADAAEEIIRAATATTLKGIAIQLWASLEYNADAHEAGLSDAIRREDIASLCDRADELDWGTRLLVAALRSTLAQEGK